MPFFSIVTVCYNSEKTIEKTIQSVLNQGFKDYEYIIIDGKSNDNTLKIIQKYIDLFNGRLHILSEKDNGIYDAMNKGIKLSKGTLIGFLNSDDCYEKDILKNIYNKYSEDDEYIYGNTNMIYSFQNKEIKKLKYSEEFIEISSLKKGIPFCHQSGFTKRDIFEKIGLYKHEYKIGADWDFIIRCYNNGIKFKKYNLTICSFSKDGISARPHIVERHKIRKANQLFKIIDINFILDFLNPANLIQYVFGQRVFIFIRELYHTKVKKG